MQAADLRERAVFTLQENVAGLNMEPPVVVDPQSVRAPTDPFSFLTVQRLDFARPAYQGLLAVLLVVLISISAVLALFMRAINDLVLGIGGLILGIWGVRSVVVPNPPTDVNAVDVALAFVILLLLVALAVRAARHYHRESQLPAGGDAAPAPRPNRIPSSVGQPQPGGGTDRETRPGVTEVRSSHRLWSCSTREDMQWRTTKTPLQREVLPIPNEAYAGPVLYDANDPAAVFPPIQEIRPPQGRAERAGGAHRRRRVRRLQRLRRADQHPDRGAPGGQRAEVQPLPHHRRSARRRGRRC